jgi:large subunit ribosomal protein L21
MQAVVKIGTSQYLLEPGQEILVDHISRPEKTLVFTEVMLLVDGTNVQVGRPFVENASVTATPLNDFKGEKIRVAKFKAKSRYRKAVGFRPIYTRIKIDRIDTKVPTATTTEVKPVRKPRLRKSVDTKS